MQKLQKCKSNQKKTIAKTTKIAESAKIGEIA